MEPGDMPFKKGCLISRARLTLVPFTFPPLLNLAFIGLLKLLLTTLVPARLSGDFQRRHSLPDRGVPHDLNGAMRSRADCRGQRAEILPFPMLQSSSAQENAVDLPLFCLAQDRALG